MKTIGEALILPSEVTDFERAYLARINRIALVFFGLHLPVFVVIAWSNGTGPGVAAVLTSAVLAGPVIAYGTLANPRAVSVIHGVAAMFMGGLLVHFGQGPMQIEMHFYFFSLLAMCAVFGNPLVIVAAAVTVALHHIVVWLVLPRSVFNYDASAWVVAVHAAFVVLESIAACFISRSFFDNVIGLERIVQTRTRALDSMNQDMRLLLDNVQQGFLTIDRDGRLAQQRSAAVGHWFGAARGGGTWFELLSEISPEFSARTRFAWDEVVAETMPIELTLEQMPHRLTLNGATHLRIDYRPIGAAEPYMQYMVIVTDVTADVQREQVEQEAREAIAVFQRALVDRSGLETFFEEGAGVIELLLQGRVQDLLVVKRAIHTLKGNAYIHGLTSLATLCHELEDGIERDGSIPGPQALTALQNRWARLASDMNQLLGGRAHRIEVEDQEYSALQAAVSAGEPPQAILQRVRRLRLEPTRNRLKVFQEQAVRIAERLDKADICVAIEDNGVRLDPRRFAAFWTSFVHAVRNAVDHGLEPADVRIAAGKAAHGTLALRTYEQADSVVVEIADDGKGIDWRALAERAAQMGLPAETTADLERALFADGVSTASGVTDISGRGVGMGALLEGTRSIGGEVSILSAPGQGTTFRFMFPVSAGGSASMFPATIH